MQDQVDDTTAEFEKLDQAYVTEQEILECQLAVWEMMRPGVYLSTTAINFFVTHGDRLPFRLRAGITFLLVST